MSPLYFYAASTKVPSVSASILPRKFEISALKWKMGALWLITTESQGDGCEGYSMGGRFHQKY